MNVTYWNSFTKKRNSTKVPSGSGVPLTVKLKENTSMKNPTLLVNDVSAPMMRYVSMFGFYYFVDNVTYVANTLWEVSLTLDPMGSYKTDIGNYTGQILRCSDLTFYNPMLIDELNKPTENIHVGSRSDAIAGTFVDSVYVLTVAAEPPTFNSPDTKNGFCRSYVLTPLQMVQIAKKFLDTNVLEDLARKFSNPMDCIISCKYMPVKKSLIAGTTPNTETLTIGGYELTGAGVETVQNRYVTVAGSCALPTKPHGTNSYADAEPYTVLTAFLPFVGTVPVDFGIVQATWALNYSVTIDVVTGDLIYNIYSDTARTHLCASYNGNCASDCPVASSDWGSTTALGGAVAAIGGAAFLAATVASGGTAAAIIGGATAAAGGLGTMVKSSEVHTQVNGAMSSALGMYASTSIVVTLYYKTPTHGLTDGAAVVGLPCNKVAKVSDHAGYLLMNGASIEIGSFDGVREEINSVMNSGFFYE